MSNILRISGGLGNQMFQYMFGLTLGNDTKFDILNYNYKNEHNGFELESIFGINIVRPSKEEVENLIGKVNIFFGKRVSFYYAKRYLFGRNLVSPNKTTYIVQRRNHKFDPFYIHQVGPKYYEGYWASEKYFFPVRHLCKSIYRFPAITDSQNLSMLRQILSVNSVSIHVRRGDFVSLKRCADDGYWLSAIQKATLLLKDPVFFIFSDDIDYCKKFFGNKEHFIYVSINKKKQSFRDMQLMSHCNCNIISNSTFSWWAAYLNQRSNHIVICPSTVPDFPGLTDGDFFCEDWIKI